MLIAALASLVACSASQSPPAPDDVFLPPRDSFGSAECVLTVAGADPTGQCIAQWVCRASGTRTLSCGSLDAGIGCLCASEDGTTKIVDANPMSCIDPMALATFGRDQCGWGDL
jgi:hypothetical protein